MDVKDNKVYEKKLRDLQKHLPCLELIRNNLRMNGREAQCSKIEKLLEIITSKKKYV